MTSAQEKIFRSVKISFAAFLVAISLWALLLPPLFPTSDRVLVNARLVEITASDAGQITEQRAVEKDQITRTDPIFSLERGVVKATEKLQLLELEHESLLTQLSSTDNMITTLTANRDQAAEALSELRESLGNSMQNNKLSLSRELAILREELTSKTAAKKELDQLFEEQIITQSQWDEARHELLDLRRRAVEVERELASIDGQLISMNSQNTFATNLSADQMVSQLASIERELRSLRLRKIETEAKRNEVAQQLVTTGNYVTKDKTFKVVSPIEGLLWRSNVSVGQSVNEGQVLATVANPETIFAEVFLGRQFIDSVSRNDRAHIYLLAEERFITGTVVEVQAQEELAAKTSLAVPSASPDPSALRLIVRFDETNIEPRLIGALGRAMISSGEPGILESTLVWLSFMLRTQK